MTKRLPAIALSLLVVLAAEGQETAMLQIGLPVPVVPGYPEPPARTWGPWTGEIIDPVTWRAVSPYADERPCPTGWTGRWPYCEQLRFPCPTGTKGIWPACEFDIPARDDDFIIPKITTDHDEVMEALARIEEKLDTIILLILARLPAGDRPVVLVGPPPEEPRSIERPRIGLYQRGRWWLIRRLDQDFELLESN